MPTRIQPLITGEIYHVFNKSSDKRKIFNTFSDNIEFACTLDYYHNCNTPIRYSRYKESSEVRKKEITTALQSNNSYLSNILAYCIMPTHYHLLLKQKKDDGISKYIGTVQNAYTRYFNTKYHRKGHLFVHEFRSVLISSEEQLKHVMRYIHLNPYASNVVTQKKEVFYYPWSSSINYLQEHTKHTVQIETEMIMSMFQYNKNRYMQFLMDHADYQKSLEHCKHAYEWDRN